MNGKRPSKNDTRQYIDMDTGKHNRLLMDVARRVVNTSPEPRYEIKVRDDILAMKEKERLGINFNRSLTASLRSRWDVVEEAQANFLTEIYRMNDQIDDDNRKYEATLMNLIISRTTNLSLDSKIEQLGGLYMHMSYYSSVLETKIFQYEPCRNYLLECCELMGYKTPSLLIDRYSALTHVFAELYRDYHANQTMVNKLQETLAEVKAETSHRNMLMHNEMADMHDQIKSLQNQSLQLERFIQEQMDVASRDSIMAYKIKATVYHIYHTLMEYRALDSIDIGTFEELDEIAIRLQNLEGVVNLLREEQAKQLRMKKRRRKRASGELKSTHSKTERSESSSSSSEDTTSDTNISCLRNRSRNRLTRYGWRPGKNLSWVRLVNSAKFFGRPASLPTSCSCLPLIEENSSLVGISSQHFENARATHSMETQVAPSITLPSLSNCNQLIRAKTPQTRCCRSLMDEWTLKKGLMWPRTAPRLRRYVSFHTQVSDDGPLLPHTPKHERVSQSSDTNVSKGPYLPQIPETLDVKQSQQEQRTTQGTSEPDDKTGKKDVSDVKSDDNLSGWPRDSGDENDILRDIKSIKKVQGGNAVDSDTSLESLFERCDQQLGRRTSKCVSRQAGRPFSKTKRRHRRVPSGKRRRGQNSLTDSVAPGTTAKALGKECAGGVSATGTTPLSNKENQKRRDQTSEKSERNILEESNEPDTKFHQGKIFQKVIPVTKEPLSTPQPVIRAQSERGLIHSSSGADRVNNLGWPSNKSSKFRALKKAVTRRHLKENYLNILANVKLKNGSMNLEEQLTPNTTSPK